MKQGLIAVAVQAFGDGHVSHMVHDSWHRQLFELRHQIDQLARIHKELHVPAQVFDLRRYALHVTESHSSFEQHIDSDAAHPSLMHAFEFGLAYIRADHCDASEAVRVAAEYVEHVAVVGSINADLHKHASSHSLRLQHLQVVVFGGGNGGIAAFRHKRETRGIGRYDMRVAVAGTVGKIEAAWLLILYRRQAGRCVHIHQVS